VSAGKIVRTRPLCAYPAVAKYAGAGDVNDATNYACSESSGLEHERAHNAGAADQDHRGNLGR